MRSRKLKEEPMQSNGSLSSKAPVQLSSTKSTTEKSFQWLTKANGTRSSLIEMRQATSCTFTVGKNMKQQLRLSIHMERAQSMTARCGNSEH